MSKKAIPENVKKQADAMVQDFNRRTFNDVAVITPPGIKVAFSIWIGMNMAW